MYGSPLRERWLSCVLAGGCWDVPGLHPGWSDLIGARKSHSWPASPAILSLQNERPFCFPHKPMKK